MFGIDIFITLLLKSIARKIEAIDNTAAVRKIILNDTNDGNERVIPLISNRDGCDCIYIPARAGPTELPIILISIVVPSDIPVYCFGVASIITFIAPTLVNDNPTDRIARLAEINNSLECSVNKQKKLIAVITEPAIIGFRDPNLDIIKPEKAPNTKSTKANGNCTLPVLIASSPKPSG